MLVNFDKTGRVVWYNLYVSKEAAESAFVTTPFGWILPCPLFRSQGKALWSI